MRIGSRDNNLTGFKRLTKAVEHLRRELREFVEEKNAIMGQRNLAWLDPRATTDQGGHARRMMRRSIGPRPGEFTLRDQAGNRMHHGGLEKLLCGKGRQQAGQPARHHRLSRSRGSAQKEIVPPGCSDLQCAFGLFLASHVAKIRPSCSLLHDTRGRRTDDLNASEMIDQADQRTRGENAARPGPGRFWTRGFRTDQSKPHGFRRDGRGQGAGGRCETSIEAELSERQPVGQCVLR